MGLNNPVCQCRLGISWLESTFEKKNTQNPNRQSWQTNGLTMNQQGVVAEGQLHPEL